MKNFIPDKLEIIKDYTDSIDRKFRQLRYGIKACAKDCCNDLYDIRYDLLNWQLNADVYNSMISLSAGIDQRIKLPTTTATLTAVFNGSDPAETILWTQLSGDPTTIVTADALITEITGLSNIGAYEFKVTVITQGGLVLTDSVKITISAADPTTDVIEWGYSLSNPYASIYDGNPFSFQFQMDYYPGTNVFTELDFTDSANEKYLVLKEPIASAAKTTWFNTAFNFGSIPDQVFRTPITLSGYRYYVSRAPVFLSVGTTKITFE